MVLGLEAMEFGRDFLLKRLMVLAIFDLAS
jgi:hypothetical protein